MRKHPEVDVVISFASLRSAFDSTMEVMQYSQVENGQTCEIGPLLGEKSQSSLWDFIFVLPVLDSHHRHYSWRHSWSSDEKANQGGWRERCHHHRPCYSMFYHANNMVTTVHFNVVVLFCLPPTGTLISLFALEVGGIKPGCFKIGNTGGMLDNILASKLYRPGSVAYVSRSGGMSNELNNIISRTTDGVFEGVAIGGDRLDVNLQKMVVLTWNQLQSRFFMIILYTPCTDIQAPPSWTMSSVTRTLQGSRW